MKNKLLIILFFAGYSVFSQTVVVNVIYSGAQAQGCCSVCGADYWCISNNVGNCGTQAACDNRVFSDPVPAGSIVTGISVQYFGAGCNATQEPTFINGVLVGTAPNDGNCACGGCSQYPIATTVYPCPGGLPSYVYGGANTFTSCPNGAFCPQRAEITITYTPVSIAPTSATASPNPSCGGAVTLTEIGGSLGPGAVYKWYTGSCGGTLVGTGASISVTPTSTTTFFVRAEGSGGCLTTACAQVTVNVNTPSVAPASATASPSTTCGGPTTLTVVGGSLGTGASWKWFSGTCGGTPEGTGSTITVNPTTTTTYFVQAQGVCNTTACVSVAVTVNSVPFAIATPSSQTICSGTATSIALSSFTSGTTFTWTVSQTGVTGGTNNGGATIAETLTNSGGSQGTAVYTITPTANSCVGSTISVTIAVDPIPVLTATPSIQTICAGAVVPIALSSNVPGTNFTWTVVETAVTGGTNSSGSSIADPLVASGGGSGTAVYTISGSANNCAASPITATITVNPDPGSSATATPATSTICSGTTTSISLSSLASGTIFTWTVLQSGASGASSGTGPSISQALTATGITPGTVTYSVATTANGCTGNPITVTVTVNPVPVVTATPTSQTFCSGNSTSIALSSNIPGTSFSWTVFQSGVSGGIFGTDSVITQTLTNAGSSSGTAVYSVVPSVNSCSGTPLNVTITVNPMDDASFVYSSATYCLSGNDPTPVITGLAGGTFTATPSGLVLNPTTGTISLASSTVGSYILSYTTVGICASTDTITMTIDNSTPFAGFTYQGSPFCQNGINPLPVFGTGASAGVFSASPIGLAFVHINTGEIDLAGSAPGTYIVTNSIPSSGPCGAVSASTTVVITASDDASFVYSSATYCTTGNPQTPVVTGLSGGVFSSLPTGLTLNPSTGTITLSTSLYGMYTLTYTTNGACPNTESITMTIDTITPSASFSYIGSPFCQNAGNNPFPLFGQNASAGIFTATPAGLVFAHVNTGEIDLASSTAGTYTVTNTIPASGICLPISDTFSITIGPADDAGFTYPSATYCTTGPNQTPAITGLTGGTFSSLPPGLTLNPASGTITLSTSTVGTYTLTYSTNGSCPNSSFIIMTIADSTLFSNFSYTSTSFCQNDINQFPTFAPGASAGVFTSSPVGLAIVHVNTGELDLSASTPGTYTLTNTIPASGVCQAVSSTITIIINPADDASFTYPSATYCTSGTPQTPTITGLPGGTFSAVPNGLSINSATGTITLTSSQVGSYILSYTTFGTCPSTSSITMTINDTVSGASFSYAGSPFCQAGGNNPFPTFVQGASAGIFSAVPSGLVFEHVNTGEIDLAGSTPGTYIVTNSIPVSGFCAFVSATYTITINAAPTVAAVASSQAFCASTTAAVSIALSSSLPGSIFTWTVLQSGLSGAGPGAGSTISQTLTNAGNSPGTATYSIIANAGGCIGSPTTVTITISPTILNTTSVVITPANCGTTTGAIAGITVTSGQAPFTYQWLDSLNTPVGTGIDLTNVGTGNYSLTVTDGNGCPFIAGPFAVNSTPAVIAAFSANPVTGETPLTVTFTNNSTGAATYLWDFGTGDVSTALSPSYVYTPLGTFKVCLTAISASNCIDSVCSSINVYINSVFIIPNIFTPNGDDENDVYAVRAVGLKTLDAEIFNRWGQKIYEWHTTNGGWDGHTASGVLAPDGTYYYVIKADGIDGKKYFEKGPFTLVSVSQTK